MSFGQLLASIGNLFRWWVVVAPWEQAVRVRVGRAVELGQGLHLRIPGLDRWYIESVRLRTIDTGVQTISTSDRHTLTVRARLRFRVVSYLRVFESLHNAEDTLIDLTMGSIAEYVRATTMGEATPGALEAAVTARISAIEGESGLVDLAVSVTDFAFVRTLRIMMNDGVWTRGGQMNYLEVTAPR